MAWRRRTSTTGELAPDDRRGLAAAADRAGDRVRSMAVATDVDGGWVGALPAHLAAGADGTWTLTPWHRAESGTWNAELGELAMVLDDRTRVRHRLAEPGLVPEVMRERIASTIVFQRWLELPGTGSGITVQARRNLVDQQVSWRATPGRGLKPSDPDVMAFSESAVRRLRLQYDPQ